MKTHIEYKTLNSDTLSLGRNINLGLVGGWVYVEAYPPTLHTPWVILFSRETSEPEVAPLETPQESADSWNAVLAAPESEVVSRTLEGEDLNPEDIPRTALPQGYRFLRASDIDEDLRVKDPSRLVCLYHKGEGFGTRSPGGRWSLLNREWTWAIEEDKVLDTTPAPEPVSVPDMGTQVHHTAPTTTPLMDQPHSDPAPTVKPYGP